MNPHPDPEELMAWRDGEVAGARAAEIADHASTCAACRTAIDGWDRISAAAARWTIEPAPAAPLRQTAPGGARPSRPSRRVWYAAAAAVAALVVASTVRVDCAPAPTCDHRRVYFSMFPPAHGAALPPAASAPQDAAARAAFERDWLARPRVDVGVPSAGERVLVVLFVDWQCPGCRMLHAMYEDAAAAFNRAAPGTVRVVTRDYPLNIRCNRYVPNEFHSAACEAAAAVRIARGHGVEDRMIAFLFDNQERLTPAMVRAEAARVTGIADFDAAARTVMPAITGDVEQAHGLEVSATPAAFINGIAARDANGLFTADAIHQAIAIELKR